MQFLKQLVTGQTSNGGAIRGIQKDYNDSKEKK
jgi:hypothetical protein